MCAILGIINTGYAYKRLDADQRTYIHRADVGFATGRSVIGISESGLYKLILRSDKEVAIPFQNWVTKGVLPSVRRTVGGLCPRTSLKPRTEPLGPSLYSCSQITPACLYGAYRRTSAEQRPALLAEGSVRLTQRKASSWNKGRLMLTLGE